MTNNCNDCHRSSNQTDGWWHVVDHPAKGDYSLCPACYRNRSIKAYRDTLIEVLESIKITDQEPALHVAMQVMKQHCIGKVRDTQFNV